MFIPSFVYSSQIAWWWPIWAKTCEWNNQNICLHDRNPSICICSYFTAGACRGHSTWYGRPMDLLWFTQRMPVHMGYGTELQQGITWQVQTTFAIWPSIHATFTSKKSCTSSFWFGWDRESYKHTVFPKWPLGSTHTFQDWETVILEVNVKVQYWCPDVQTVSQTVFSQLHFDPCFLFRSHCIL
jgi:hypothetical protein